MFLVLDWEKGTGKPDFPGEAIRQTKNPRMSINEILNATEHRPWELPKESWKYYQEWNNAVFLHWQIELKELIKLVPKELEPDLYEGKPWISLVAFTMEKIRPRFLPALPPISYFHEINIRTYVRYKGKPGVYFLSILGAKNISCKIARLLSGLRYEYSKILRNQKSYTCLNSSGSSTVSIQFKVGPKLPHKTGLELWLTERYALFNDTRDSIDSYEIHHVEWPLFDIELQQIDIAPSVSQKLIEGNPDRAHYSKGVQVLAWQKKRFSKLYI